jgi:serine-type D-Ala-D-Ala endopeptidase (penicillin-binding protein 7)
VRVRFPLFARYCLALVLGVGVSLPVTAGAQTKTTSKPASTQKPAPTKAKPATAKPATAKPTTAKPTAAQTTAAERRARLARAQAEARAREQARLKQLQEAMTPRYKTDVNGLVVPDVRAAAAIIFNPETGEVLWEENAQAKRSIASITKVMTAVVLLEHNPDLSRVVTVQRADVYAASVTYLRAGDRISLNNLLHLTLIASDNAAARAIARAGEGGAGAFIDRMNEKALELGLDATTFSDPSGLSANNVSSAYDISRLISFASADERIAPIMMTKSYTFPVNGRRVTVNNTNRLVREGHEGVLGGKTGFISKAGHCLATLMRLPNTDQQVAVVVLGAASNPGRFYETRHLFNWLSEKAGEIFAKEHQEQ